MNDSNELEYIEHLISVQDYSTAWNHIVDCKSKKFISADVFEKFQKQIPISKIYEQRGSESEYPTPTVGERVKIQSIKLYPPTPFLCERIGLLRGSLTLLCGTGWSGKTLFAQYLAMCIATNQPLFNEFDVKKGKVLHIDGEMSKRQVFERYSRIAHAMPRIENDVDINRTTLPFRLDDSKVDKTHIESSMEQIMSGFDLVIIDSLKANSAADENTSAIEQSVSMLRKLSDSTGAAVLLIHHKGKGSTSAKQSGRGHSSIYDGVDVQIDIESNHEQIELSCAKNREGKRFSGLSFRMEDVGEFVDHIGKTEGLHFDLVEHNISSNDLEASILNAVKKNPNQSKSKIISSIRGDNNAKARVVDDLICQGKLICTIGSRNAKLLSIGNTHENN